MKRILIILIFGISISACEQIDKKAAGDKTQASEQTGDLNKLLEDSVNFTTMHWLDSTFLNLGKVEEGQVVEVAFRFKNTGDKPLIIASVSVGCGCTTITEKPKEPLTPGQEGVIKAKFDSKNLPGERLKEIYVRGNTKNTTSHILMFRVEVVKTKG